MKFQIYKSQLYLVKTAREVNEINHILSWVYFVMCRVITENFELFNPNLVWIPNLGCFYLIIFVKFSLL